MSQERSARPAEKSPQDVTNWTRLEAELQRQKDLFASQLAIARATTEHPALERTLQNILDVMTTLTGAEGATLFLFDQAGGLTGRLVTQSPLPPQQPTQASRLLARGLVGWVARLRKPALVHDTVEDERWLTLELQRQETRAALCVPILMGDVLLGVLTLIHSRPRHFSEAHLHFVQAASDQLALALRNAQVFDAMPSNSCRGGGAVSVAASMEEGDPETLRITVTDTGTALAADVQSRLFRKFATGDQRERGSGLGLAFCKLAVEAHGGRIWLDGVSARGISFAFTLPIVLDARGGTSP